MQGYTTCRATALALICAMAIGSAGELRSQSAFSYVYSDSDGIMQMSDSRVSSELTGPMCAAALRLRVIGGGETEYITVYGGDAEVFANDGSRYARRNLEDAYSQAATERIRAVVSASYPVKTLDEVIADANAATEPHRFDTLTESDAIAAAQAAIWSCSNAKEGSAPPLFAYKDTRGAGGKFCYDAEREALINGFRDYLLSLEPQHPEAPIADIFVKSAQASASSNCFSLNIIYGSEGRHCDGAPITLLATSRGGKLSGARSLGGGLFALTLTAKNENQDRLTLTLTGSQRTGGGVYLYRAEGGDAASQCFVGRQTDSETSLLKTLCFSKAAYGASRD